MAFNKKIDEWMKEAEERPSSAVAIVKLVANRLRELTERNEELLAENIALENGTRVEEYQKRIAHLEYQLELLKRRFGVDEGALVEIPAAPSVDASTLSLLIYNAQGRIFRLELNPRAVSGGNSAATELGHITGEMVTDHEPPRILAVPSNEDVLLLAPLRFLFADQPPRMRKEEHDIHGTVHSRQSLHRQRCTAKI